MTEVEAALRASDGSISVVMKKNAARGDSRYVAFAPSRSANTLRAVRKESTPAGTPQ
jgi:hypothetical protein